MRTRLRLGHNATCTCTRAVLTHALNPESARLQDDENTGADAQVESNSASASSSDKKECAPDF
jgi:hypothetical protein